VGGATGSDIDVRAFRPGDDGPLADFAIPDGESEVDRYWVNAPYAYVVITYHDAESEHRYYAVEPELDRFERDLLDRVVDDIRDPLLYREGTGRTDEETLRTELEGLLEGYGVDIGMDTFHALAYYLYRDFRGYGKVDPFLNDRHIEDISCDGYDLPDLRVPRRLHRHRDQRLVREVGARQLRDPPRSTIWAPHLRRGPHGGDDAAGRVARGTRARRRGDPRGSAFTIRQYAEDPLTPIDLVEYGTFSIEQMAYFWLCIEHNKSLIFAGGTASGKTTSMNAVSMFVPPRAKILTIEDTRELSLYHDNWLSSITRERRYEGADIDMYDLLRSALRHRPEYIVVGEVRGAEAITLFQAMNTGHTTFSTMHADSIETVINRLENEPINVPRAMVQSLDMLSIQTLTRSGDQRVRRAKTIGEIGGIDQRTGELDYSSAFEWDAETDEFSRNDSSLMEEIADERGWSRSELLREVRRRERFLELLRGLGVTDYRAFTALVNEYYADPERVMDRLEERRSDGAAKPSGPVGDAAD